MKDLPESGDDRLIQLTPRDLPRTVRWLARACVVVGVLALVGPIAVLLFAQVDSFLWHDPAWAFEGEQCNRWLDRSLQGMLGYPGSFVTGGLLVTVTQLVRLRGLRTSARDGARVAASCIKVPLFFAWMLVSP